jgi:hypothetical protein
MRHKPVNMLLHASLVSVPCRVMRAHHGSVPDTVMPYPLTIETIAKYDAAAAGDHCCRGMRVLLMTDDKLREKYSRLLDSKYQAATVFGNVVMMLSICSWVQTSHMADEPSYCLGTHSTQQYISKPMLALICCTFRYIVFVLTSTSTQFFSTTQCMTFAVV